jgi:hypothetical protein
MTEKLELITEDKSEPAQVDVPRESKESSDAGVEVTPSRSSGRLAFHGNCGSNFLWRGPRSINSLILEEVGAQKHLPIVECLWNSGQDLYFSRLILRIDLIPVIRSYTIASIACYLIIIYIFNCEKSASSSILPNTTNCMSLGTAISSCSNTETIRDSLYWITWEKS